MPGDEIPLSNVSNAKVLTLEPHRSLVLMVGRDPERQGAFTWVWGLYPEDQAHTRLVTRLRWRAGGAFSQLLIDTVEIWMMRKCLLGIKRRAEDETQRVPAARGPS